jgi:hypothetical protein
MNVRWVAGLVCAAFLAACGGGGGGGGGGGAGPGPDGGADDSSEVFDAVSVQLRSPSAVHDVFFAGSSGHGAELQIGYSGNVGALAGRPLFVLLEVPDPLYESHPTYWSDADQRVIHLFLGGNLQGVPEGRYTGTMKIRVCLDAQCKLQLRNSPLSVPYDVEMKSTLTLSPPALDLETAFGTLLPASEVTVTLPFGGTDWSLPPQSWYGIIDVKRAGDKLVITPSPFLEPGTYKVEVDVQSSAPDPVGAGTNYPFGEELTVTYTVKPSATPVVVVPASASYVFRLNDPSQGASDVIGIGLQDRQSDLSLLGVRYDASPASAAGHPLVNAWLYASAPAIAEYSVSGCTNPAAPNCLPTGTYRAAILYRHTSTTGARLDFEFPVTMTIVP